MSRFSMVLSAALWLPLGLVAEDPKPVVKTTSVSPASAASGKAMYISYCAVCHGKDGKGDGPAAPALKVAPPDLTQLSKRNSGKFPELKVYGSIRGSNATPAHGSKDMPIWGPVFLAASTGHEDQARLRANNLTRYIESLQAP